MSITSNHAHSYNSRLEFSREWNIPVHHFLRRHVYFPTRCYFSQTVAMVTTFLVSSVAHELVMSCITKKLRGYGFLAMMLQLPIVTIQRSKFFRGKTILNVCIPLSSEGTLTNCNHQIEPLLLALYDSRSCYGMHSPLPLYTT